MGRSVNPEKKDAVENPVAWTYKTAAGGRVFTTTLGHPEDFRVEAFQRLVVNAVHWTSGLQVPDTWAGKMTIDVPYRGMRGAGK
jgi:type 1 glutamine amidotransferase